ncbi:MAG: UDP-N-acetylglucosamine 2-epimerase (non-hydrolyzing) [Planctomycetes bacterium]|nr:UDP-N-acetylglucosamine 2-epimerase (non-hydrolyzing) [Planctomycetota bacterium]
MRGALNSRFETRLVHTGQHYDPMLSGVFFQELDLPVPDVNLGVGSAGHAEQVRSMTAGLRAALRSLCPCLVLAYGDTNSTLAAALAAAGEGLPLVHVEAGLRSRNRRMPEEVNRIVTDHLSDLCLAPTPSAVANLAREGLSSRTEHAGDIMLDACLSARERAGRRGPEEHGLRGGEYRLATVHRAENTDLASRLSGILAGLEGLDTPVILPLHPRTRDALGRAQLKLPPNVTPVPPAGYLSMVSLAAHARTVLTDSGGLQKEAFFLGVPCVTLREETEWPETLAGGWNRLAGSDPEAIRAAASAPVPDRVPDLAPFGNGRAAERIARALECMV